MHHAPMHQCTNAPMQQCTNAPMHSLSSISISTQLVEGVTKLRYMQFRDSSSSSASLGFRVEGVRVDGSTLGDCKRLQTPAQLAAAQLERACTTKRVTPPWSATRSTNAARSSSSCSSSSTCGRDRTRRYQDRSRSFFEAEAWRRIAATPRPRRGYSRGG